MITAFGKGVDDRGHTPLLNDSFHSLDFLFQKTENLCQSLHVAFLLDVGMLDLPAWRPALLSSVLDVDFFPTLWDSTMQYDVLVPIGLGGGKSYFRLLAFFYAWSVPCYLPPTQAE